jgi:hypothetical protein
MKTHASGYKSQQFSKGSTTHQMDGGALATQSKNTSYGNAKKFVDSPTVAAAANSVKKLLENNNIQP